MVKQTARSKFTTSTARSLLQNPMAVNYQVSLYLSLESYPNTIYFSFLSPVQRVRHPLSLSISVHQRRWYRWLGPWFRRRQEEVCELWHSSGEHSRHDDMRLLPAAGHDQCYLQGRDVRLADVLTLHLLRVRKQLGVWLIVGHFVTATLTCMETLEEKNYLLGLYRLKSGTGSEVQMSIDQRRAKTDVTQGCMPIIILSILYLSISIYIYTLHII